MQTEFIFSGFGGQGVMFAGQLLSYAALKAGKEVTWIPSYGPEMRGGTAHCFVVISDRPIGSPVVKHPTVAVVFNAPSFDKYASIVAPDGLLVVNSTLIKATHERTDIQTISLPASTIAESLGNLRLTNMVLLGAMLTALPVLDIATVRDAVEEHIPAHRRALLPHNFEALEAGARHVTPARCYQP